MTSTVSECHKCVEMIESMDVKIKALLAFISKCSDDILLSTHIVDAWMFAAKMKDVVDVLETRDWNDVTDIDEYLKNKEEDDNGN